MASKHTPKEAAMRRAFKGIMTGQDRDQLAMIAYLRASRETRRRLRDASN